MTNQDLPGTRFGKLTVIGDSGQRRQQCILWRCRCDCGNEILLLRNRLTSGIVTDCGCESGTKSTPQIQPGQQVGYLTVLQKAKTRSPSGNSWLCRCVCGKELVVPRFRLITGQIQSCGCRRYGEAANRNVLTGRRFGRLTVQGPAPHRPGIAPMYWRCLCDCGNEIEVMSSHLLRGVTMSCGCLNHERRSAMHQHLHYENGTCLERLVRAQKTPTENTSGFRGVSRVSSGKWRATISFRKVHYSLGCYRDFDDAVKARMEAETVLHAGYLKARTAWDERAASDPEWAEKNPFYYNVRCENHTFEIDTNGTTP